MSCSPVLYGGFRDTTKLFWFSSTHEMLDWVTVSGMSEQEDALDDLGRAGIVAGICWAWHSTVRKVLSDYERATGHDQGWLGYTAHTIFRDRLDRVSSCDRFALGEDVDPSSGVDVVREGLDSVDVDTMPLLAPSLVRRGYLQRLAWLEGRRVPLAARVVLAWEERPDSVAAEKPDETAGGRAAQSRRSHAFRDRGGPEPGRGSHPGG